MNKIVLSRVLCITVFLTNLSQLPVIVKQGRSSLLSAMVWVAVLLIVVVFTLKDFTLNKQISGLIICVIILFITLIFSTVITGINKLNVTYVSPLIISMLSYFIGYCAGKYIEPDEMEKIYFSYIISTVILSVNLYTTYFSSAFAWESRIYAYGSKNSVSQIILTAIILLVLISKEKKIIYTLFKWCIVAFLTVLLMMLKSRGSIIGIPVIALYVLLNKNINKKLKIFIMLLCVSFVIALMINNDFYNLIVNNVLLANRGSDNLDDISSGRLTIINEAIDLWRNTSIFWGYGNHYIDLFYLSSYIQTGLLSGTIINLIAFQPLFFAVKHFLLKKVKNIHMDIFIVVVTVYLINGIFEGLTPLGPGVKCYFLWLLFGIYSNKNISEYKFGGHTLYNKA